MTAAETHSRFLALASRITYPGLDIEVIHEEGEAWMPSEDEEWIALQQRSYGEQAQAMEPCTVHLGHYLRVSAPEGSCNVTTQPMLWKGRKWRLSEHMTDFEFVLTAFKALLTALEHEARELFKVDGVAVLDSHLDLDSLLQFRQDIPNETRT